MPSLYKAWMRGFKKKPATQLRKPRFLKYRPTIEDLENRLVMTVPIVSGMTPDLLGSPIAVVTSVKQLAVTYSVPVLGGDQASSYDLRNLGDDGVRDTSDDVVIAFSNVSYSGDTATLSFAKLAPSANAYELTIFDSVTGEDLTLLDGDGDGNAGGNFVRDFYVAPAPASSLAIMGLPGSTIAGTPTTFTLTALDADGDVASGYNGTVAFQVTGGNATVAEYTFTSADHGTHTFTAGATFYHAGNDSITANDGSISTHSDIQVAPSAATHFGVAPNSTNVTIYSPVGVTVTALDAYDNIATDYAGTVQFTSSDANATLPSAYTFAPSENGTHTFSPGATFKTIGSLTLTATDAANGSITGVTGIQTISNFDHFAILGAPSAVTAGVAFSLTVVAKDAANNTITNFGDTIHFSSSDGQATLPNNFTYGAGNSGSRTFSFTLKTAGTDTLTITNVASNMSTTISLPVNAASVSKLSVSAATSAVAGAAFNTVVRAIDAYNNTVTSYAGTIHLTSTDVNATLPSDYTFTSGDNGTHTFTTTLFNAGTRQIVANDTANGSINGKQAGISVTSAAATKFVVTAANTSNAGDMLDVTVVAKDAYANIATGYVGTVHIASSDFNASLPTDYTFLANENGTHVFHVPLVTAGTQNITISDAANSSITGKKSGIVVSALTTTDHFLVSAAPSAVAGAPTTFTVTAVDVYNNRVNGYQGSVQFSSSDPFAGLPTAYTFTAGDNGSHTFTSSATFYKAGVSTLIATDVANGTITGSQSAIQVSPSSAAQFVVSASQTSVAVFTPISVTVTALDAFGNTATGYTGAVRFTSNAANATLPSNYTFTSDDNGTHTFTSGVSFAAVASNRTLTATDLANSSLKGIQTGLQITASAFDHFAFVNAPANVTAGSPFSMTVIAKDAYNNTITSFGDTIHFSSSDIQAALPLDFTYGVGNSGSRTFTLTLKTAGTDTLTLTDLNNNVTASLSFDVSAAAANKLVVSAPTSAVAGVAFNTTVRAIDAYNNTVTSYGGTIHFTSTDANATLPDDYTFVSEDNGVHTFTTTVLVNAGTRSITANDTATGSINGKQQGISVAGASAARFVVSSSNTTTAGAGLDVTVTAKDTFGNVATGYNGTVHFASTDVNATLPSDYTFLPGENGTHTFHVPFFTAGNQNLTVTDAANASIIGKENGIVVLPQSVDHFLVAAQSLTSFAGAPLSFTVTALDVYNNPVTSGYLDTVHFSSNDPTASLPADYTFTAADNGFHTFNATFSATSANSTIIATDVDNGAISGTQSALQIVPSVATRFVVAASQTNVVAGTAMTLTVTAVDTYGNVVTDYTGSVRFASNDLNAALPANYTFLASDNGTHSFDLGVSLYTTGSNRTLTVTDLANSTLKGTQSGIQVTAGALDHFALLNAPTSAIAGASFNMTVVAKDAFNNTITSFNDTLHFSTSDAAAVIPADFTYGPTNSGSHTFSLTLKTAGMNNFTISDLTSNLTMTANVTISAAAMDDFLVSAPSNVASGSAFNATVSAVDAYGNLVSSYNGTISFTSTDINATLPANYTFTAGDAGTHTFSVTMINTGTRSLSVVDTANATLNGKQQGIVVGPAIGTSQFLVTAPPLVTSGTPFTFTVTAQDAYGTLMTNYTGTVHFTTSDPAGIVPPDYTFTAEDAGVHTFNATLFTNNKGITVTDVAHAGINGKIAGVQLLGGPADRLMGTAPPSVVSGSPFQVTFFAKDAFGNLTNNYTGTVRFTSSDLQAILPDDYTFTPEDMGQHTFTVTLFSPGIFNVVATDTVNPTITGKQSTSVQLDPIVYLAGTNTVYINGVTATLTDIKNALPNAPLTLVDAVNHIWQLDANIVIINGGTLNLHGTAVGGDVDQFRMRSNNNKLADGSEDPANSVKILARYGNISIKSTVVTSWDEALQAPDTNIGYVPPRPDDDIPDDVPPEPNAHIRAYIAVRSFFAADGVTPLESRMDVIDSEVGYLGSHVSEGYGLTWKAITPTTATEEEKMEIHSRLRVYGDIINSHIHHNFFGVYTYGAYGMNMLHNEVNNNVWYGLDPHDDSNNLVIEYNYLHNNGTHGLILSKRCMNAIIRFNVSENNHANGIMLHRSCDNAWVEGNISFGNGDSGLALFEVFGETVINNTFYDNAKGIRLNVGSANNTISGNEIFSNTQTGIDFFKGNDPPLASSDAMPNNNLIVGNIIHDNLVYAVRALQTHDNIFKDNTFYNGGVLFFDRSVGNVLDGNSLPIDALIKTSGTSTFAASTSIRNESVFSVLVDAFSSTVVLGDSIGTVYTVGTGTLPTTITSTGSSLILSNSNIGTSAIQVQSRNLHASLSAGSALVTPTVWASAGTPLRAWTTKATSATQPITYAVGDLVAGSVYTVTRNSTLVGTSFIADANGVIHFTDAPGTTSSVTYSVAVSIRPNLPAATAANVSYNSTDKTITVTGAVSVTLSQLRTLLPSAPLAMTDVANKVWYLQANILLTQGAYLILEGGAIGGDVNTLHIKTSSSGTFNITANWGGIYADTTAISSWTGSAVSTSTTLRSYITVISPDSTHLSTMDILRSDVGYLGYNAVGASGLSWNAANATAPVLGTIFSSRIHNNFVGAYFGYASSAVTIVNSEFNHNSRDGLTLHLSSGVDVESNQIHDNTGTGINITGYSTNITVSGNTIKSNSLDGIALQSGTGYITIENNNLTSNAKFGIELITSDHNTLHNNFIQSSPTGISLSGSSGSNTLDGNNITLASANAINIVGGANRTLFLGNLLINNNIHDNTGYALRIQNQNDTTVTSNIFSNNTKTPAISVEFSADTWFTGNTFSANTTIKTTGNATLPGQTFIGDQSKVNVQVDAFSSVTFNDIAGTIYKPGSFQKATTIGPLDSQMRLTSADIGTSVLLVSARQITAFTDGGTATLFTETSTWDTTGKGIKRWTTTAGTVGQMIFYTVGDGIAGATYNVLKNGVFLESLQADANGVITFSDSTGTLSPTIYTVAAPVSVLITTAASVAAGSPLSITVTIKDLNGATFTGYTGTVHFTSSDNTAILPSDYKFTAADAGVHVFTITPNKAGTTSITATDADNSLATGTQNVTVTSSAASLGVTSSLAVVAGNVLTVTVTAKDINGNNASNYLGTVQFTSSDALAGLPANYTFTAADAGVHTFSVTLKTAASASITVTDTTSSSVTGTQTGIVVSPAIASVFTVVAPTSALGGTPIDVTVTAKDAFGNIATGYTGTVKITSNDSAAVLPANYTFNAADAGVHVFSVTLKTSGSRSITATDTAKSSLTGTQSGISVAGVVSALSVTTTTSAVTAGNVLVVTVSARDAGGNLITGYTGTVHFTSTDPGADLPADYTFTAADLGTHTFNAVLKKSGTMSVTATDTVKTTVTGSKTGITVNAGTAVTYVVSAPVAVTGNSSFNVTVTAKDAFGNNATGYTGTVQFASTDGAATLPAEYTFKSGDKGVRQFSVTLRTAGVQSVTAKDKFNSAITGTQSGINVTVNAAVFAVSSASAVVAGEILTVTVTAKDSSGSIATGYTGTVHFTSSDTIAGLPADYTFTAADAGVHTFSVVLKTAGSKSITVKDTVKTSLSGTKSSITVNPAAASVFTFSSPPTNATAGSSFSVTVTAKDAFGNVATGYTGRVHLTSTDPTAVLSADYTFKASEKGVHKFTITLKKSGPQSITFTDTVNGAVTAATPTFTVKAGNAASYVLTAPSNATANTPFTVTVTAYDAYGNIATGYTGTVKFTSTDTLAVLPANYKFTAADQGTRSFTVTLKSLGSRTLTATDNNSSSIKSVKTIIVA